MANKSIVFHSWGTLCLCTTDRHSGDLNQFASSSKRLFSKCSVDESLSAFLALMFDYCFVVLSPFLEKSFILMIRGLRVIYLQYILISSYLIS